MQTIFAPKMVKDNTEYATTQNPNQAIIAADDEMTLSQHDQRQQIEVRRVLYIQQHLNPGLDNLYDNKIYFKKKKKFLSPEG